MREIFLPGPTPRGRDARTTIRLGPLWRGRLAREKTTDHEPASNEFLQPVAYAIPSSAIPQGVAAHRRSGAQDDGAGILPAHSAPRRNPRCR